MKDQINSYLDNLKNTIDQLDQNSLAEVVDAFLEVYNKGGNIYIFGNGGSAATASHIAGDFIKGASYGLEKRFKMICLNDNPASMMAIANDIGYEDIFIEPLKNHISSKDLVIGISGSGNSENVVRAMNYAKSKNVKTISFCGYSGGKIKDIADISVHATVEDMEITEDIHLIAFHNIKQVIIRKLKGDNTSAGAVYDSRIK